MMEQGTDLSLLLSPFCFCSLILSGLFSFSSKTINSALLCHPFSLIPTQPRPPISTFCSTALASA